MHKNIILISGLILHVFGCSINSDLPYRTSNNFVESDPIEAIFISSPTLNNGAETAKDNFSATIKISKAFISAMSNEQVLYFVGNQNNFNELKNKLQDTRLKHISATPYMWQQDLFEFSKQSDKIEVLTSYGNKSMLPTISKIISAIFPNDTTQIKILTSNAVHGTTGGNIEFWPKNIGIIGTSDFPDPKSLQSFEKQVFKKQMTLNIPTSWLTIGHVDEVIKLLRYTQEEHCSIDFIINSPAEALKLLATQSNFSFLDEMEWGKKRFSEINSIASICALSKQKCENFKNQDFLDLINKNQQIFSIQNYVEQKQIIIKKMVENVYAKVLPECKINWVHAPALYLGKVEANSIKKSSGQSIFPSLTNGVLINNTYIVADPGNAIFRENFRQQMKVLKFNTSFVPLGKELYTGKPFDGHIHCMTQVLRTYLK